MTTLSNTRGRQREAIDVSMSTTERYGSGTNTGEDNLDRDVFEFDINLDSFFSYKHWHLYAQ